MFKEEDRERKMNSLSNWRNMQIKHVKKNHRRKNMCLLQDNRCDRHTPLRFRTAYTDNLLHDYERALQILNVAGRVNNAAFNHNI